MLEKANTGANKQHREKSDNMVIGNLVNSIGRGEDLNRQVRHRIQNKKGHSYEGSSLFVGPVVFAFAAQREKIMSLMHWGIVFELFVFAPMHTFTRVNVICEKKRNAYYSVSLRYFEGGRKTHLEERYGTVKIATE